MDLQTYAHLYAATRLNYDPTDADHRTPVQNTAMHKNYDMADMQTIARRKGSGGHADIRAPIYNAAMWNNYDVAAADTRAPVRQNAENQ